MPLSLPPSIPPDSTFFLDGDFPVPIRWRNVKADAEDSPWGRENGVMPL